MINEKKYAQFGKEGLIPKGITIHNTSSELSARELFEWLNNECKTSQGTHYLVDYNEIIEVMPLTWKVFSTGKGEDYSFHNCISIEICSNINNELYFKGEDKAIELIKELMKKYNLKYNDIFFHNDFNERTYCPSDILNFYGNKKSFIKHIKEGN